MYLFFFFSSHYFDFQSKVKVRRASISEPSDTDYEPRLIPAKEGEFFLNITSLMFNKIRLSFSMLTTTIFQEWD